MESSPSEDSTQTESQSQFSQTDESHASEEDDSSSSRTPSTLSEGSLLSSQSNQSQTMQNNMVSIFLKRFFSFRTILSLFIALVLSLSVFAIDRGNRLNAHTRSLYTHFANNICLSGISGTTICQTYKYLTLRTNSSVMYFWKSVADKIKTTINDMSNTLFLNPPVTKCISCRHNLVMKQVRQCYGATNHGIVTVIETTYRCCNGHCALEGNSVGYNYWVDNRGRKRIWHNQMAGRHRQKIHSPYLNKNVYMPSFIRWGDNYLQTSYLAGVSKVQALTHASYTKMAKIYTRTIYATQSDNIGDVNAVAGLHEDITWFTPQLLQQASFFQKILWVHCTYTFCNWLLFCSL